MMIQSMQSPHFCGANGLTSNRRGLSFRALCSAVFFSLLIFVLPLSAQNTINTVAGGGTINSSSQQADIPGPTAAVTDASEISLRRRALFQYIFEKECEQRGVAICG